MKTCEACGRDKSRPAMTPLLLTGKDCAALCSVSLRTWQRWVATGEAPRPVYIANAPRWVAAEIEAWVDAKLKSRRKVVV
jgi:predicted DNA-binding transcriptional regulator AlpA